MTDTKSPGDRLLEVVVFAPAGLAATIVEEFPRLVEKGRHRVEGQVHTARLVGQFAFQMGRRQIEQTIANLGARSHRDENSSPGPSSQHRADERVDHIAGIDTDTRGDVPTQARTDADIDADADADGDTGAGTGWSGPGGGRPGETARPPSVWMGDGGANGTASASSLAIPGYDSLSASQVVQRLEGLSSPELEEVRAHEAAHRQRRTILHRVEQLLAGGDGAQP